MVRHEVLRCDDRICNVWMMGLMYDLIETRARVSKVTSVVWVMRGSYQTYPCEVQVRLLRWGRRDPYEHRNFLFLSLDGDPSCLIIFRQPDSFSLKEILQEDPSKPFSRRRMLKLGIWGTMNSIMLVNKNIIAARV